MQDIFIKSIPSTILSQKLKAIDFHTVTQMCISIISRVCVNTYENYKLKDEVTEMDSVTMVTAWCNLSDHFITIWHG